MKTIWILVLVLSVPGFAAAGSVVDLGDGWYAGTDNQGRSFTSVPLGDGWRTTVDNDGRWTTTVPIGRGLWATVGPGSAAPVIVPVPGEDGDD